MAVALLSPRWLVPALCGLAFSSILITTPPVAARCVDDAAASATSARAASGGAPSHSTTAGCGGGGASSSCPPGGVAETDYGSRSYATASVSWSCRDANGVYHDVTNGHGCGGVYEDCARYDGCSGSCWGYWSSTSTWTAGNPDARAGVIS